MERTPDMATGIFVTGTDTGVGKTRVACAMLRAHVGIGLRAVGMKPIASGVPPGASLNEDVIALAAAGNVDAPIEFRNPYSFDPAIAPHLAARDANVRIDLGRIRSAYEELCTRADRIVVEGAGGVLVPINDDSGNSDMLDVARAIGAPLVLVVGLRLGCINHALLSVQAILARGLNLQGWVPSAIDPSFARIEENVATLERRIAAPRLPTIPWNPIPRNPT